MERGIRYAVGVTIEPAPRAVHYPETDHMGEHELQRLIMELLRPLIERWLADRGVAAHVGADTFFYFVEGDPTQRVAPDVYVLPGVPAEHLASSYKLWEVGRPPSFVLEVVTSDWTKDYDDMPAIYGALGVDELAIFDPGAPAGHPTRVRWQLYRRRGPRSFPIVERTNGPRIWSEQLEAALCSVPRAGAQVVRLAESMGGPLFATQTEAEQRRAEAEQRRADEEQRRAEAAEREVERLKAALAAKR